MRNSGKRAKETKETSGKTKMNAVHPNATPVTGRRTWTLTDRRLSGHLFNRAELRPPLSLKLTLLWFPSMGPIMSGGVKK